LDIFTFYYTLDPRQFILFGNFKYNRLGDKGKIFLSDIVEIKGGKEIIEKVERKVGIAMLSAINNRA